MQQKKDVYKVSRGLFIAHAAVEYFISILVGTTYLAKLGTAVGLDDGTIGLVTSFLALGCAFQIVSVFLGSKMGRKSTIILLVIFDQLCFGALYLVPFINLPSGLRIWIFIGLLLAGNILINVCSPNKIAWSRGIVEQGHLGRYSALNEIISLVSGMLFSFSMGAVIDALEAKNQLMLAFAIIGAVLFILTEISTIILLLAKEKKMPKVEEERPLLRIKSAFSDKTTLKLIPLYILWYIALYTTTPFFGTYAINELGFTMTAVSVISAVYAALRAIVSRPIGSYADKTSFVNTLTLGFATFALALLALMFGGKASYVIYYLLYAVTMAATNAALASALVFEYVLPEKRASTIAVISTLAGLSGFLSTLATRPLVNLIQKNGNRFLFIDRVYAQQVVAVIGIVFAIVCIVYVNLVVRKMPRCAKLLLTDENAETKA